MKIKIAILILIILTVFAFIFTNTKIKYANNVLAARKYISQKDYIKAAQSYREALKYHPGDFEIYQELAGIYKITGKNDELENIFFEGLKVRPNDKSFLNECIAIAIRKKDMGKAQEYIQKAIKESPNDGKLYFLLGRTTQEQGKTKEALEAFEKALSYDYDKARCHYNMACIYEYSLNDLEKSLEYYAKYLQEDPGDKFKISSKLSSYSQWSTGQSFEEQGLYPQAVKEYESKLEKDPGNLAIITRLGRAYRKNCQFPESEKIYIKVLNSNKNEYYTLNNLGSLYYEIQRYNDAESCWKDAVAADPKKPNAHFNLGALYAKTARTDLSESEYNKALECGYNESLVFFQLAEVYKLKNNPQKADEFRNKALSSPYYTKIKFIPEAKICANPDVQESEKEALQTTQ